MGNGTGTVVSEFRPQQSNQETAVVPRPALGLSSTVRLERSGKQDVFWQTDKQTGANETNLRNKTSICHP